MNEAVLACDKTTSYQAILSKTKDKDVYKKEKPTKKEKASVSFTTESSSAPKLVCNKVSASGPANCEEVVLSCNYCKTTKSHVTADCRKIAKLSHADQQSFMGLFL